MPKPKVLLVDDDKLTLRLLGEMCRDAGYTTMEAACGTDAVRLAHEESPDIILLDLQLPDESGLEIFAQLKNSGCPASVIMMTDDPQIAEFKAAVQGGVYDFVGKPINVEEVGITIGNALEASRLRQEVEHLRHEVRRRTAYREVIGTSEKMMKLMDFVHKVAKSEATTILIQGESGTGKDLIAKSIHFDSRRENCPFVAINCSAIPENLIEAELFGHERGAFTDAKAMKRGLFEAADGGTLFLDEVGELSPIFQAKLLRVLEDQGVRRVGSLREIQVDVRVIAASNRDLAKAVQEGYFRQDLYYRLAIISIFIPPLREHKEDIPALVDFFVSLYNRKFRKSVTGISDQAMKLLMAHDWPGNVRELRNAMERAMILEEGKMLRADYLPIASSNLQMTPRLSDGPLAPLPVRGLAHAGRVIPSLAIPEGGTSLEDVERSLVELALQKANGNQAQAAQLLDIGRDAFRYKMKKFGLMPPELEKSAGAGG
jgi:two-component system, NtrC family, response regulator AtoC